MGRIGGEERWGDTGNHQEGKLISHGKETRQNPPWEKKKNIA